MLSITAFLLKLFSVPDCHLSNEKKKIELDLSNYLTKKDLDHATGFDTSDLGHENFYALKAEFDNLELNRLTNAPTNLSNLKRKLDKVDGPIKNCSCRLEKRNWCSR